LTDLPRDLDLAARSHQTTARQLSAYGSGLAARQRRADELERRAEELRRQQAAAVAEVNRIAGQRAPEGSAELAALKSQYNSARSRADGYGTDLAAVIGAARRLHGEHQSAAASAARAIREVADAPYKEPGWLSRAWDSVKGWISDHADVLATISGVLKGVSAVLGVLSLVPGLQFLAPFALLTAGAALLIDVGIKVATGKGSWTAIGIDAALTFLPGGKILSGLKGAKAAAAGERGLAAGERALSSADDAARGLRGAADDIRASAVSLEKRVCAADPVDVATGQMVMRQVDAELPGLLALVLARTHISSYRSGRSFGPQWASTLDIRIEVDAGGVCFADDDGTVLVYPTPDPAGGPVLPVEGPRLPLTSDADGQLTIRRPEPGHTLHFDSDGLLVAVADRVGSRIEILRDRTGVPVEVRHSGGYRIAVDSAGGLVTALRLLHGDDAADLLRYGYDEAGRLTEVVNSSGLPLRFEHDAEGRIVRWEDRNGIWYSYDFEDSAHGGRCVRTDGTGGALGATFSYGGGPDGRVTVVTDSLGHRREYHLNDALQVVREVDPLGAATTSQWDRYDRLLSRTDPLGRTTRCSYDGAGNLVAVRQPDGRETTAGWDERRRPIAITGADGAVWRYTHDERGLRTAVTDPAGATSRYSYDSRGHLVAVADALRQVRRVETDAAGLPVAVTDPLGATTRYTRDAFGRVVAVTDPLGHATRFEWTVEGKLAARALPDGATERWAYDGEGNEVAHTDALGQLTRTEVRGFDLPTARVGPDGARTEYAYDTELRLVAVTGPTGLVWRYDYDPAGRLAREVDVNGREIAYSYDAAGQLSSVDTTGAGTTVLRRDLAGRIVERRSGDLVSTFSYDGAGRVVRATGPDADVVLDRDTLGRVRTESINGRAIASRYDLLGRRVWRRTPSGAESRWEYGPDDQPAALRAGDQLLSFDYDAAGRETERRIGSDIVLTQTWDPVSRLTGQTLTAPSLTAPATARESRPVQQRTFAYRADSTLAAVDDLLAGPRRYELDPTGRVTAVTTPETEERYAYDRSGVLASAVVPALADSAGGDRSYTGTLLRRAGAIRYEHDAAGRVVLRQHKQPSSGPRTWRYEWNPENRLAAVVTPDGARWRYAYDAFGRRIAKQRLSDDDTVAEQVDFAWDGPTLTEQASSSGAVTWDWDDDGLRALTQRERRPSPETPQDEIDERFYAIVTDLVGTPTELVSADGSLTRATGTTLWGTAIITGPTGCPLRFPGQYHDPETGLHYNHHRYYDPTTARYVTPDPLGLDGGPDPHAYVPNPTTWIDPLGLTPCDIPWSSPNVGRAARELEQGATSVTLRSRSEAEELFLRRYQGDGYVNTTGMKPQDAKDLLRTVHGRNSKELSYHWDEYGGTGPHDFMPHVQIHDLSGNIIRIHYPG
jgi:RHS repeat-associated protein